MRDSPADFSRQQFPPLRIKSEGGYKQKFRFSPSRGVLALNPFPTVARRFRF
jgi:hypothetical protein